MYFKCVFLIDFWSSGKGGASRQRCFAAKRRFFCFSRVCVLRLPTILLCLVKMSKSPDHPFLFGQYVNHAWKNKKNVAGYIVLLNVSKVCALRVLASFLVVCLHFCVCLWSVLFLCLYLSLSFYRVCMCLVCLCVCLFCLCACLLCSRGVTSSLDIACMFVEKAFCKLSF